VLATKVFGKMHDGPGSAPTTSICTRSTASTPTPPVAETMEALHDIVRAGKVRYLGASSMYAWQFAKLQHAAGQGGWTRFVSMQNQYNLLRRQDEPELMAMCADTGVGLVPYSPQGKGRLARPWGEQSVRSSVDHGVQAFDSPWTSPSSMRCRNSPAPAASPWPKSRSPGCCGTRLFAPRSSARPNRITCPKPSPLSS
jgi:1-deoxyxylulose-5-phosphate synthase